MEGTPKTPTHRPVAIGPVRLSLKAMVLAFAALLVVMAGSGLVFVGDIATREANTLSTGGQGRLLQNALLARFRLLARDQLSLARWDRSVERIANHLDHGFVVKELVDSLWFDFGHDRVLLIGPKRKVLASAVKDAVDFAGATLPETSQIAEIAARAAARFDKNRIRIEGGYGQRVVPIAQISEIATSAYLRVDGKPFLASAMAIVPDDGEKALESPEPVILVSLDAMDAGFLKELNRNLGFKRLNFVPGEVLADGLSRTVMAIDGRALGSFVWTGDRPGDKIWRLAVPVILFVCGVLAAFGYLVAGQIGRLSGRLEESERVNRHLASHDGLTGLANRTRFRAALDEALAGAARRPFALMACDLDRFKAVNDTFGHAGGDKVIRTVAERLAQTVGKAGMVARIGGDEFVVLVTGFADRPRLTVLSGQLIDAVCEPIGLDDGEETDVGISIGIAIAPDEGDGQKPIMAAADAALYEAKDRGRGVAVLHCDLDRASDERRPPERVGGKAENVA